MPAIHRPRETTGRLIAILGEGPFLRSSALATGAKPGQLRAALASGQLLSPQRGVLIPASTWERDQLDIRARHLLDIRSAVLVAPAAAVVGYDSAAVVHRLWLPRLPGVVHLIAAGHPDRTRCGIRLHESVVPDIECEFIDGLRLTSLCRTAVDVARGQRLPAALIPLDSALRLLIERRIRESQVTIRTGVQDRHLVRWAKAQLHESLGWERGWPWTIAAREAIEFADPASESAHESRSRGWFIIAGLPAPRIGVPKRGADGRTYWLDFWWEEFSLGGEADGWGKYGTNEADVRHSFRAEKRRQEALEATGVRFVRWTPDEAPAAVVRRVTTAMWAQKAGDPLRGVVSDAG